MTKVMQFKDSGQQRVLNSRSQTAFFKLNLFLVGDLAVEWEKKAIFTVL